MAKKKAAPKAAKKTTPKKSAKKKAAPKKPAAKAAKPAAKKPAAKKKNNEFDHRLKSLQKHWKGAKENAGDFENLDAGGYVCWLNAEIGESANGRLQVTWRHQVAQREHEQAGFIQPSWTGLEKAENLVWLARTLSKLEYELDDLEITEIADIVAEINENPPLVRITVRENEGSDGNVYTNVYIQKVLDVDDYDDLIDPFSKVPAAADEPDPASDEDEAEAEAEAEEEDEVSWAAMGASVDSEEEGFEESMAAMTEAAGDADLDPDDFASWEVLGEALDAGGGEIAVGSNVWCIHKKRPFEGEVTEIDGDKATVQDGDGNEIEVELSRLEVLGVPF